MTLAGELGKIPLKICITLNLWLRACSSVGNSAQLVFERSPVEA